MIESSKQSQLLSLTLFVAPVIILKLWQATHQKPHQKESSSISRDITHKTLTPPLPQTVRNLLSRCHLAYLSTVDQSFQSSHLSLMRFTYLPTEEVIIMSTNRKTKKFEMLQNQHGVALLVHDFGGGNETSGGANCDGYSITLNGACEIVTGDLAERYRDAHLKHNPDYPQFIVGDNIAILKIAVTSARICNINDQVIHWNIND